MNKITRTIELMVPKVTTGPISASSKVYDSPADHPDLRVPFREIALTDPEQPSFRVYDSSGPYTDADATIERVDSVMFPVATVVQELDPWTLAAWQRLSAPARTDGS